MHHITEHSDSEPFNLEHLIVGSLATNCWIVPLEEALAFRYCAIIDPGADAAAIIARLERRNLRPRYILLTHGHFDHIAALPDLVETFRGIEIAIHRDDAAYLGPDAYQVHRVSFTAAAGNTALVDAIWKPMPSPTVLVSEGNTLGPFQVIHLPGHSAGSVGFYDEQGGRLFSGDTLFKNGIGRTDLPGGDEAHMRESLKRLFAMDGAIRMFPGHGPASTLKKEKRHYI
ncbi:MAG: MBL fold metallo-hydrolase [Treponema sp.]|jgi:glyoxylase-like metal-dependent hydrolase (beta-lactamase superfamily II)|nr:MBL fold metallo-hydrolase [Treponema sp.]